MLVLRALERDLLAVALQFENAEAGGVALFVVGVGFFQAFHVRRRVAADFRLEPVDFGEDGALS